MSPPSERRRAPRVPAGIAPGRIPVRRARPLWPVAAALVLLGPGCLRDTRISRDRGGVGLYDNAPEVPAPKQDRCAGFGKSAPRAPCEEMRSLAWTYVRRLSPGDQVCLEGGFGEAPGAACQTRASVDDAAPDKVLLQIREARPESRWFHHMGHEIWFAEGALVDLYLAEQGY